MRIRRTKLILISTGAALVSVGFQAARQAAAPEDPLIAGFKKSTVASVSDAVDQVVGQRGYMSHDMRPYSSGQIVGRAVTALLRPTSPDKATPPLSAKHSVEMIDNAKPGEVGVIVVENGLDVAAMGGLMGTDAKARGLAGFILDAGVRDLAELRALKLPVYARGVVPSTTVSRFGCGYIVSKNTCTGWSSWPVAPKSATGSSGPGRHSRIKRSKMRRRTPSARRFLRWSRRPRRVV